MALSQHLGLRQSHALVMTPQLMQAIKLLQLSNLDLAGYVEGELERNPLLERADEADAERPPAAREPSTGVEWPQDGEPADLGRADRREDVSRSAAGAAELDDIAPADADAAASRANGERPAGHGEWANARPGTRDGGDPNLEAYLSADITLADHLAAQLVLAIADPARRMIGRYLIDLVDEAGYLVGDLAQVGERLGAPPAQVEAVLAVLQGFDPPGVCARSLAECLTIQLTERNRLRSGDGGAACASRPAGQARLRGAAPHLRRRR